MARTLAVASVHSCPTCRAEARKTHERSQHLSPEIRDIIARTERAYQELEAEFEHERRAELAALARGEKPRPGQAKLDRERGITGYPEIPQAPTVEERFRQFMEQSARDNAQIAAEIMAQVAILKKRRRR